MKFEDRMESLVWKALMGSFNLGLNSAYKKSEYFKYIWVTPKAETNCKICKAMNGVELLLNNVADIFPAHPNCCCVVMPKA